MFSNNLFYNFNSNTYLKSIFTNPLGKRGAVASLGGGATTKSKSNETGGIANHSMCYHNQGFRDCNTPLKSKLNGGQNGRTNNIK